MADATHAEQGMNRIHGCRIHYEDDAVARSSWRVAAASEAAADGEARG
jgi:hypothetical protein